VRCSAIAIAAVLAGCGDVSAPTMVVEAQATEVVRLESGVTGAPKSATVQWDLESTPAGSHAETPVDDVVGFFTPDLRGDYVLAGWLEDGLSSQLVVVYEVEAAGKAPVAKIAAPAIVAVGATVTADGTASASDEGLPLAFHWRLAVRPEGSTAELASSAAATTAFVPDLAGDYAVELSVSDGELAGEPKRAAITAR
jgi:hypothetical protein